MKKHSLALVLIIILVLITTSCNLRIAPVSGPQSLQAGDRQSGDLRPQGPQPDGLQPRGSQPGVPQPAGLQPGGPVPGEPQAGNPLPAVPMLIGPRIPDPTATPGPAPSTLPAQGTDLDLAASDIYAESSGRIMLTIKNVGSVAVKGNIPGQCGALINEGPVEKVINQNLPVDLEVGAAADVDTGFRLDPSITKMTVACSVWAPQDANTVNDSTDYTQVR